MKNYRKTLLNLITIFLSAIIIFSCSEESISEKDERLARERENDEFLSTSHESSLTDNKISYWYVVAEKKNKGYKISTVIEQEHNHFSIAEAKEQLGGDVFILNFIRISKKTYDAEQ